MKTAGHAPYQGLHPMVNWMFPFGGILMTAVFTSCSPSRHLSLFLVLASPFLLLGLACRIARKSAVSRTLGFTLTTTLFSLSLVLYLVIYALAQASPCSALGIALATPVLMWLHAITSSLVLLGRWLRDRATPEPPELPPRNGMQPQPNQASEQFPRVNGDKL